MTFFSLLNLLRNSKSLKSCFLIILFISPPLMTQYFPLLLNLLELQEEEISSFTGISEVIAQHLDNALIIHHRMGFVFEAWWEYLHDQISLEEFLATGDVSSNKALRKGKHLSSFDFLQQLIHQEISFIPGSMVLLDEVSFLSLSKKEQEWILSESENNHVLLLLC